jgi:hypothetical protein
MIDLFLWIPDDFDKRYKKYLSKFSNNKIQEPFLIDTLTKEKENLLLITDRADYEFEIEKWKPLKIIIDAIYKELSPFEKESQSIKIDISKLDISENIASSVLMMLTYERVCKWKIDTNPIIMTTENLRKYLKGDEVIVQNYENLSDFRKKISDFYNFMEQQKIQKFSEIKPLKIEKKLEITTTRRDVCIENNLLCFNTEKIPVERGLKSILELFIKNANIYRGDKLSKKGNPIEIKELIEAGGYKDETAFRDGLKRLRAKIAKSKIPATIDNTGIGKYQFVIKYQ